MQIQFDKKGRLKNIISGITAEEMGVLCSKEVTIDLSDFSWARKDWEDLVDYGREAKT